MEKYLGENMPKLGFGLMRLPMSESGEIDVEQTKQMVDLFLSKGFVYFDTAYCYNNGESEKAIAKALVERYPRDQFLLATKLPAWDGAKDKEDAQQRFYTSLERTGAGYFDYFLLHNLGESRTHFYDDYDIWDFLQKRKEEGLIRHLGFSFHDKADVLDRLLTLHPEMEFVQLQINYADWDNPQIQSGKCYEVARKHGKPVIIMEPVKGGCLANPPEEIRQIFRRSNPDASPSSFAIRFAASLDGVITVLSGMSNLEQMKDNVKTMENFTPLTDEEKETVCLARKAFASMPGIPCTSCNYCASGCPAHVGISGVFNAYNMYKTFGDLAAAANIYCWNTEGHGLNPASDCIQCGACEHACPQHISVREELKKAVKLFGK